MAIAGVALLGAGLLGGTLIPREATRKSDHAPPAVAAVPEHRLTRFDLLTMTPDELAKIDIAAMNIACADGLPGFEGVDPKAVLATIDGWAARVKQETDRHIYKFHQNPSEYENSEAFFRMMMLVTVLQLECGVQYDQDKVLRPDFTDSRSVFIHGLTGGAKSGTCISMPVLNVAVGRRLGYPLKLVTTIAHVYAKWESATESFNIECTSRGLLTPPDDHFREWPFKITDAEVEFGNYLKPLSPSQELALFFVTRGHALYDLGRLSEAQEAYSTAHRLDPTCRLNLGFLAEAVGKEMAKNRPPTVQRPRSLPPEAWIPQRPPQPGGPQPRIPPSPVPTPPTPGPPR